MKSRTNPTYPTFFYKTTSVRFPATAIPQLGFHRSFYIGWVGWVGWVNRYKYMKYKENKIPNLLPNLPNLPKITNLGWLEGESSE
jgi:hypothetical protein